MSATRMKFWGWGPEDRQPAHEDLEQFASGAREHLGFGAAEAERPARVEDLELRAPRLEPPASRGRATTSGGLSIRPRNARTMSR